MGEDQEKESTGAGWMVGAVIAAILGAVLVLCVACTRRKEPETIEPDTDAPAETQPAPQAAPTLGGVAQDAAAKISAAAAPGIAASPALSAALSATADAASAAFEAVKARLGAEGGARAKLGTVALATVRGDIHDIGKNIVKVLLENYGFEVVDLGKDVPPEAVAACAKEHGLRLVGLSALMTTTVPAMEETIRLLRAECPECKVMVGGAVLTQETADRIGADFYSKDAMGSVRYARSLFND